MQKPSKTKKNILLLGHQGSGKKKMIETLTDQQSFAVNSLAMGRVNLHDSKVMLYAVNPNTTKKSVLSPILQVADGAVIMVNSASVRALDCLQFYIDYTNNHQINHLAIGIWQENKKPVMLKMSEVYSLLDEKQMTLPVIAIEDEDIDDMQVALECVIVKSEVALIANDSY